jgi:hypothetical protein
MESEKYYIADIVGVMKHLPLTWEQALERAKRFTEGGRIGFVICNGLQDVRAIAHDGKLYLPEPLLQANERQPEADRLNAGEQGGGA